MFTNMKKITLLTAIAMIAFTVNSFGQETATSSSTATVISPIGIANTTGLNFGNVAVQSATSGTVKLVPGSTVSREATGGATLPSTTGTVSAAIFDITGEAGYTYSIKLPTTDITLSDGATTASTMTVGTFTSSPSATGQLSTSGAQTIYIGGTLSLAGGQTSGTYTNASDLVVEVNYN